MCIGPYAVLNLPVLHFQTRDDRTCLDTLTKMSLQCREGGFIFNAHCSVLSIGHPFRKNWILSQTSHHTPELTSCLIPIEMKEVKQHNFQKKTQKNISGTLEEEKSSSTGHENK